MITREPFYTHAFHLYCPDCGRQLEVLGPFRPAASRFAWPSVVCRYCRRAWSVPFRSVEATRIDYDAVMFHKEAEEIMSDEKIQLPTDKPASRLDGYHLDALDDDPETQLASLRANPRIHVIVAMPTLWEDGTSGYVVMLKDVAV